MWPLNLSDLHTSKIWFCFSWALLTLGMSWIWIPDIPKGKSIFQLPRIGHLGQWWGPPTVADQRYFEGSAESSLARPYQKCTSFQVPVFGRTLSQVLKKLFSSSCNVLEFACFEALEGQSETWVKVQCLSPTIYGLNQLILKRIKCVHLCQEATERNPIQWNRLRSPSDKKSQLN